MVNKIIVQYLAANKRLVIPEFGAFIRKDAGETVFVEFLKKDDQIFSGLIRDAYGVNESEARLITEQFVEEVKNAITRSGTYVIGNLGTLKRDGNGVYELIYDPAIQVAPTYNPEKAEEQVTQIADTPAPTIPIAEDVKEVLQQQPAAQTINTLYAEKAAQPVVENKPVATATTAPTPVAAEVPAQQKTVQQPVVTPKPSPQPEKSAANIYQNIYNTEPVGKPEPTVYGRPIAQDQMGHKPVYRHRHPVETAERKKKADIIMIVAVIAALIAMASIVFGILVDSDPIMSIQPTSPQQEQVDTPLENESETEQVDE